MVYKIVIFLLVCLSTGYISAVPDSSAVETPFNLDLLHLREASEGSDLMESRLDGLGDLTSIIAVVTAQFQSIIQTCIDHIANQILAALKSIKLNILNYLANLTLADLFEKLVDCLTNVLVLMTPEVGIQEADEVIATAADDEVLNLPYGLSFFRSNRAVKNDTFA